MQVTEAEGRLFYHLHVGLQLLVNRRHGVIHPVETFDAFMALPPEKRLKTRDALYAHPESFDEFLKHGDLSVSADAAEIVAGWRDHRATGVFFIFRHLRRHTVFLSSEGPPQAFGVLGLTDPLERLAPYPPVMVTATLLPFRGRIIYDGFLTTSGPTVTFGGGFRRMLDNAYRDAKATSGIITSLPHAVDLGHRVRDEAAKDRLRALLKNERSRRLHWEEILELRESGPELERVYHQERGKADARQLGRCLRRARVNPGWFALYEGIVIASAPTREEVVRRIREVLPTSRSDLPYLYQLRK
jgi:hypothetical protein